MLPRVRGLPSYRIRYCAQVASGPIGERRVGVGDHIAIGVLLCCDGGRRSTDVCGKPMGDALGQIDHISAVPSTNQRCSVLTAQCARSVVGHERAVRPYVLYIGVPPLSLIRVVARRRILVDSLVAVRLEDGDGLSRGRSVQVVVELPVACPRGGVPHAGPRAHDERHPARTPYIDHASDEMAVSHIDLDGDLRCLLLGLAPQGIFGNVKRCRPAYSC